MAKSIFRQAALERLSSPEQLDQLMQVTTPKGWLALVALGSLLITAVILSFVWDIPVTARGQCILAQSGGVNNIVSLTSGRIGEVYVEVDEVVEEGQVIARIYQPDQPAAISKVVSPYAGRIVEIKVAEGSLVNIGTPILSLERIGKQIEDLEAVVYVSPTDGKKVHPGMEAQISPSIAKREEVGFMYGTVTSVGKYPATLQGMFRALGSNELVQTFSAGGIAPIEVHVELELDPESASGYLWSSPKGSEITIQSGTLCSADIVVDRRRLIDLVLPIRW